MFFEEEEMKESTTALSDLSALAAELALPDLIDAFFKLGALRSELGSEIEKMKLLDEVNISAEHINRLENSMSRHQQQIARRNKNSPPRLDFESETELLDEVNISSEHIDRLEIRMKDELINRGRRRQQIARRRSRNSPPSGV